MKSLKTVAALAVMTLFTASALWAQDTAKITVSDAWTVPNLTDGGAVAVYFTLTNPGDKPAAIVGAHSSAASRAELHNSSTDAKGVMSMDSVLQAEIPAHGNLYFKPGGLHVMLFGLKQKLEAGKTFPLTLEFRRHGTVGVNVEVRPLAAKAEAAEESHEHHH